MGENKYVIAPELNLRGVERGWRLEFHHINAILAFPRLTVTEVICLHHQSVQTQISRCTFIQFHRTCPQSQKSSVLQIPIGT